MDVNVELFSSINTKLQTFNLILFLVWTSCTIVSIFIYDPEGYILLASIGGLFFVLILIDQIWQKKSKSIGKITFSANSVTIVENDNSVELPLDSLKNAKLSAISYYGKPMFPNVFYVDSGEENYFWPDRFDKSKKYRFKLIGREHRERLMSRFEGYQFRYPSIKISRWI